MISRKFRSFQRIFSGFRRRYCGIFGDLEGSHGARGWLQGNFDGILESSKYRSGGSGGVTVELHGILCGFREYLVAFQEISDDF